MKERVEKLEGKVQDLGFQLKDFRDYHSPFNIEQLSTQIQGLDNRTLTMNDRMVAIEDGLRDLGSMIKSVENVAKRADIIEKLFKQANEVKDEGNKPAPVEDKVLDRKDELDTKEKKGSGSVHKKS